MSTVYLIDASPIFYRAFFGIPFLSSKNGVPTNAVYGYTKTILSFLRNYNPEYVGVCFDRGAKKRKELFSDYKIDRKPMDSNLARQVPVVKDITQKLGLTLLEKEGYEADDLIGMMTKFSVDNGHDVVIISPDKDMAQLVNDKVKILDLSKKEILDRDKVKEKFNVYPEQVIDLLALSGDAVDGIPGVLGIGPGTATKLLNKYGSLDQIYNNLDQLTPKLKDKLAQSKSMAYISKNLATILVENETDIKSMNQLLKGFCDKKKMQNYFDALNFMSLQNSLSELD